MLQSKVSLIFSTLVILAISSVQAETLRDPTRPGRGAVVVTSQADASSKLVLNSVIRTENSSRAVINNKIFSIGDRVQGVKIIRIDASSVSLSDGRKLRMYQTVTETKGN